MHVNMYKYIIDEYWLFYVVYIIYMSSDSLEIIKDNRISSETFSRIYLYKHYEYDSIKKIDLCIHTNVSIYINLSIYVYKHVATLCEGMSGRGSSIYKYEYYKYISINLH
jgi:hypothetical protein